MSLKFYNNIDLQEKLKIENGGFEKLTSDKTPSVDNEGNEFISSGTGGSDRKKIVINNKIEEYAFLTDLEKKSRLVGTIDCSSGDLSLVSFSTDSSETILDDLSTMDRGDSLIVTVAGDLLTVGTTALGVPQSVTYAEVGDVLVSTVDSPSSIDDFIINQTNIDLRALPEPFYETLSFSASVPSTASLTIINKTNVVVQSVTIDNQLSYIEGLVTEDANGVTTIDFSADIDLSINTVKVSGIAYSVV